MGHVGGRACGSTVANWVRPFDVLVGCRTTESWSPTPRLRRKLFCSTAVVSTIYIFPHYRRRDAGPAT
jgi:hypothetical protein